MVSLTTACLSWFLCPPSVPRAPEIDVSGCSVQDNAVHVAWRSAAEADADGCWPIQRYELEYRKTTHRSALVGGACWERICDITETQIIISGRWSHSGTRAESDLIS